MDLADKLLEIGYTYYKFDATTRYLARPTDVNGIYFFVKPLGKKRVSQAQIYKFNKIFKDPFIEPKNETLSTVEEVESFYQWAIKKAMKEVEIENLVEDYRE